ncbi:MAG: putative sulfurtransferase, partial [Acidimicrobiia bacterium]|nr:putative sulfurtransferase [Acidimicrobiia bacterium]
GASQVLSIGAERLAMEALGYTRVPDLYPGEGPVGGIITALASQHQPVCVVAACDLAGLTAVAVSALVEGLGDADVSLAYGDRLEPLLGAWRARCEAPLQNRFDAGERAVHRAVDALRVATVPVRDPRALSNLNSAHDLARWLSAGLASIGPMAIEEISVDALAQRLAQGSTPLIDVRQPDEYREAHVPGAVLIPLDQVPDRLAEVKAQGIEPLIICKSGGRSMSAATFLATQGIAAVNVAGGTSAWIASGRDVHIGDQP